MLNTIRLSLQKSLHLELILHPEDHISQLEHLPLQLLHSAPIPLLNIHATLIPLDLDGGQIFVLSLEALVEGLFFNELGEWNGVGLLAGILGLGRNIGEDVFLVEGADGGNDLALCVWALLDKIPKEEAHKLKLFVSECVPNVYLLAS